MYLRNYIKYILFYKYIYYYIIDALTFTILVYYLVNFVYNMKMLNRFKLVKQGRNEITFVLLIARKLYILSKGRNLH